MKIFTAKEIKLLGEKDDEYGQTYYGSVHEQKIPIRFNIGPKHELIDFVDGRKFAAEGYEDRKAKGSGNPYTQLTKVKLVEDVATNEIPEFDLDEEPQEGPIGQQGFGILRLPQAKTEESFPGEKGTNARWAIGMAYRAYQQVMGTPEGADGEFPFDIVKQHASELVRMFEEIKEGE